MFCVLCIAIVSHNVVTCFSNAVERKRMNRMKKAGKVKGVETFATLVRVTN